MNSAIFTVCFTLAMSLINIGSTVAFNAMLSLSSAALMATYVISISCVTARRFNLSRPLPPARWSLGRLMGISGILFFVHARKIYNGPVALVEGRGKHA